MRKELKWDKGSAMKIIWELKGRRKIEELQNGDKWDQKQ